jgi:hypothetical protein
MSKLKPKDKAIAAMCEILRFNPAELLKELKIYD